MTRPLLDPAQVALLERVDALLDRWVTRLRVLRKTGEFAAMDPTAITAALGAPEGWVVLGSRIGYLNETVIARRVTDPDQAPTSGEAGEAGTVEYLVVPFPAWLHADADDWTDPVRVPWLTVNVTERAEKTETTLGLVTVGTLDEVLHCLTTGPSTGNVQWSQVSALLDLAPENTDGALDTLLALTGVLAQVNAWRADPDYHQRVLTLSPEVRDALDTSPRRLGG